MKSIPPLSLGVRAAGAALLLATIAAGSGHAQQFVDLRHLNVTSIAGVGTAEGEPVVVGNGNFDDGPRILRWTPSSGSVRIGPPSLSPIEFYAEDISADGSRMVGRGSGSDNFNRESAYHWVVGGAFTEITGEIREAEFAVRNRISDDGNFVVGRSADRIYRWGTETGFTYIGPRFSETTPVTPSLRTTGVSPDGAVVVGTNISEIFDVAGEAVRWTEETGRVGLGVLSENGGVRSMATDLSADGSIVIGSVLGEPEWDYEEAFRWNEESGMVGLGFMEGGSWSRASFVASDGSFILGAGNSALFPDGEEPFLWTLGSGMQRLIDVLSAEYGLAGWQLGTVLALSADDRFIVGNGVGPDGQRGTWLVDLGFTPVPEPSTYGLLGAAGLLVLAVVRRRQRARADCRSRT